MTAFAQDTTRVALDGSVAALSDGELDRLLATLAGLGLRAAESVAEQIAALRLAGATIDLLPTEAELAALRLALEERGGDSEETGRGLARLAEICDGDPLPARGAA